MVVFANRFVQLVRFFTSAIAVVVLCTSAAAGTLQYVFDETSQLTNVIDQDGDVAEYVYDEVGNILEIKRYTIDDLAILDFTPHAGPVGTIVMIQGRGFSNTPSDNLAEFNGVLASVTNATTTTLQATVPPNATTGPISVTVAGNTAVSSRDFMVLPGITFIEPKFATAGSVIPNLNVQGTNLPGSTFNFTPDTPPLITVTSANVDAGGESATLEVNIDANAVGSFVLVATNSSGSSKISASEGNSLTVLQNAVDWDNDGLTNEEELALGTDPFNRDTDGDGAVDGAEVSWNSDPLRADSLPSVGVAAGATFLLLNTTPPPTAEFTREAPGRTISVLNSNIPTEAVFTREAVSPVFSMDNLGSP